MILSGKKNHEQGNEVQFFYVTKDLVTKDPGISHLIVELFPHISSIIFKKDEMINLKEWGNKQLYALL